MPGAFSLRGSPAASLCARRNCSQIAFCAQIAICPQTGRALKRDSRRMAFPEGAFVGSEAIANGRVRKHELRSRYRLVFPDVYVPRDAELTLPLRARAGWLWSHREGVIAGLTASALHGAKWVDDVAPIELAWRNARPAKGLRTSDMRLLTSEFGELDGMRVTTAGAHGIRHRPAKTSRCGGRQP